MSKSVPRILVTGGAGFIGSAVCRLLVDAYEAFVVNVDKLTYAANLHSLDSIADNPRYVFERADICNRQAAGHSLWALSADRRHSFGRREVTLIARFPMPELF